LEGVGAEDGLAVPDLMDEQSRASVAVDGDDLRIDRLDREITPGVGVARGGEMQLLACFEVAKGAHELERDDVVINLVDEAVAQKLADAEEIAQPAEPRTALVVRAAGEAREVYERPFAGELLESVDPLRGE